MRIFPACSRPPIRPARPLLRCSAPRNNYPLNRAIWPDRSIASSPKSALPDGRVEGLNDEACSAVMPGLVPGMHVLSLAHVGEYVDGLDVRANRASAFRP